MSIPTLNVCIFASLQRQEMHPDLPQALLTPNKTRVRLRYEDKLYDYKEELNTQSPIGVAELAKDIGAFHNTEGGVLVVGITDEYIARGVSASAILQTKELRDKLSRYIELTSGIFQATIELPTGRTLWLIFARQFTDSPRSMLRNGPEDRTRRPIFVKGDYFYRDGDEVRKCLTDLQKERLF